MVIGAVARRRDASFGPYLGYGVVLFAFSALVSAVHVPGGTFIHSAVGLAPHGAREGDLVFVAVGADVPYVLRSCGDGYELIGECYVQGIMDGEVMGMDWIGVQDVMIR